MTKSKGYGFIVDEENIVSEPETEYGPWKAQGLIILSAFKLPLTNDFNLVVSHNIVSLCF